MKVNGNSIKEFAKLFVFILGTLLLCNVNLTCAQCDECPELHLSVYDMDVRVPVPEGHTPEILKMQQKWLMLKHANSMLWGEIADKDPTYECIIQIDPHFINSGDVLMTTVKTVPPLGGKVPDMSNYLVHGWIEGSEGNYVITHQVETAYSREVVRAASKSFSSLLDYPIADSYSMQIARESFIPIVDIIRNYEKDKRDNNNDVNIFIDKITVTPEKSKVNKGEEVEVEFKLIDCDGTPLKGREILLQGGSFSGSPLPRSTNGRFANSTIITDDNGIAKAAFKAGIGEGKAVIRVYHKYYKPYGDEYCADGKAEIQIKKERPEKFLGWMEAKVTTHKAHPDFSNPNDETVTEETYYSGMEMGSSPGSVEKLRNHDFRANVLQQQLQYPIFWGITVRGVSNGEPQKVKSFSHEKSYSDRFGEFLLDHDITTDGESNGYDWNFSVNPYARQVTGIQSIDANAQYCVKLYMSGNIRLHSDPKYKTTGRRNGKRRIDSEEFEQVREIVDKDCYLGLAQCDCDTQVQNENKYVLPLIIDAPQRLEDYLLNPEGDYELNLSGRWYDNEDGTEEFEKSIKLKIHFSPVE